MLANQILQKTVHKMSDILQCNCSVWDVNGEMLAAVGDGKTRLKKQVRACLEEGAQKEQWVTDEVALFLVKEENEPVYLFVMESIDPKEVELGGRLCVSQLESLLEMNKVKMDKNRFVQNLLLGNMMLVDIYNQARRLSIAPEQRRVVLVIEPKSSEDEVILEMVRGIYTSGAGDYVTAVDGGHVILVKSLEETEAYAEVQGIALMLIAAIHTEIMVNVRIAYGTIVEKLEQLPDSYKEAGIALEVGRIFYREREVLAYRELGIGRLIHQLPQNLCEMFLKEVFREEKGKFLDEETMLTVDKFFENNLNISETARQLFVHRNTLVHRLEKIEKYTGLDVRIFEDALTFKIALMVADQVRQTKEYQ